MGEILTGTCEICGAENVSLIRRTFYYDCQCECHSPCHFDIVKHCVNCKASQPKTTKITVRKTDKKNLKYPYVAFTVPTDKLMALKDVTEDSLREISV